MMKRTLYSFVIASLVCHAVTAAPAQAGLCSWLLSKRSSAPKAQSIEEMETGKRGEIQIEAKLPKDAIEVADTAAAENSRYSLSPRGWGLIVGGAALSGVALSATHAIPVYGNVISETMVFVAGTLYSLVITPVITTYAGNFANWMIRQSVPTKRKRIHPNLQELHNQRVETEVVLTTTAEYSSARISECQQHLRLFFRDGLDAYRKDPIRGWSEMIGHWVLAFYGKRYLYHDITLKMPVLVKDFQMNFLRYIPDRQRLYRDLLVELQATDEDLANPATLTDKKDEINAAYKKLLDYWILGIV